MSKRLWVGFVLTACLGAPNGLRAQPQPEYPVVCSEGSASIRLSFGVHTFHTSGCQIGPGATDSDTFALEADAGDTIRLTAASPGLVDPRVILRDPGGGLVEDQSCVPGPCAVQIEPTLTVAGTYTVTVTDQGGDDTGDYVLQVDRLDPHYCVPALPAGAETGDSIDPRTDLDVLKFEGRSGDNVRVEVVSTGTLDPRVEIYDSSGAMIGSGDCNGPCTASIDTVLSSDGIFRAVVSDFGSDETGGYTISFDCISGECLGHSFVESLVAAADGETFQWQPVADLNATYALIRGNLVTMRNGGGFSAGSPACLTTGGIATSASDPEDPGPGAGFFYAARSVTRDGYAGGYDGAWGPSQICGRSSTVCDAGSGCDAPIPVPSTPFSDTNNTCGAPAVIGNYNNFETTNLCNTLFYAGPELVYQIELGAANDIGATLTPEASADLGVFFVTDCSVASSCVAWADNIGPGEVSTVSPGTLAAGTYYIYVDAFYASGPESCGEYTLELTGPQAAAPKLLSFDID